MPVALITAKHCEDTHRPSLLLLLPHSLLFPRRPPPSLSSRCAQSPGEVTMCHSSKGLHMNLLVRPPPPPPHLSYLQKLPGDLHDLQGGGSSESRSDDEMRIIFSRSLWVHPWAAFKSVLICETNSEVSLTSSWPAGRGVAGRSPPRDCAFLSLSCNNVCQTGVVPICQPDSHHKNLVYIFHLCYHRRYKCFLRPEAHTRLAVPGFLFNKDNNRLNNWGKVQICQTPWPQRCTSA